MANQQKYQATPPSGSAPFTVHRLFAGINKIIEDEQEVAEAAYNLQLKMAKAEAESKAKEDTKVVVETKPFVKKQLEAWQDAAQSTTLGMFVGLNDKDKPKYDPFTVDVSHVVYPEDTTVVVFRDMVNKTSTTRHYQEKQYLGKNEQGQSNSKVYLTDVTRLDKANMQDDILKYLKEGIRP